LGAEDVPVSGSANLWHPFKPWAGLVAAVVAVAVAHQFGSDGTFDNCLAVSPGPLLVVAIVCCAAAVVGGWSSAQVARKPSEEDSRKLIAVVSVGFAGLALFAILLPMIASLMLPPCFQ
jgi:hypothetical protein